MFFVDEPYISDFFKQTLVDHHIPVVNTASAKKLNLLPGTHLISEEQVVSMMRESDAHLFYSTSENAIGWIAQNLPFSSLPKKLDQFKNKARFRQLTQTMFPNFYYKELSLDDLKSFQIDGLPLPFIIKPNVGFFSMGVHKVSTLDEWQQTVDAIHAEIEHMQGLYPAEVLGTGTFIIEQCIEGDEFAVDAYFDSTGEPVILNILHHTFSSDNDVSDRVYTTSKAIIETNLKEFTEFVGKLGQLTATKNFPVHIELRRDVQGVILPIEVNPMRFGGWCSTPDLAYAAYGLNPYLYYLKQQKPNWAELLHGKEGKLFSVVVLDNSTGKKADEIASFDFEKLLACFEKPLELRKIDYHKYPVFAFLFVETREDNFAELEYILKSDLDEFVTLRK
ncbi:MAG: ATP-grasp domain-containing protein [Chloroflexi bacterium HGW-Chloroflexi-4]|nr:MAG: ATP-grasp domain-containing protein [Chloroflexi bacterium HGW-Chloroflexi-4]